MKIMQTSRQVLAIMLDTHIHQNKCADIKIDIFILGKNLQGYWDKVLQIYIHEVAVYSLLNLTEESLSDVNVKLCILNLTFIITSIGVMETQAHITQC